MPTLGQALAVEECRNGRKWAASGMTGLGDILLKADGATEAFGHTPCEALMRRRLTGAAG